MFVGLPVRADLSVKQDFELRLGNTDGFETMIRRAFDVLFAESAESGQVIALSLQPPFNRGSFRGGFSP